MRIERRLPNGTFTEAAKVEGTEWIDKQARFGEEQQYRLTAISGTARSETFTTQAFTPQDTFAPAIPAGLTGVAGLGSIELSWERPADTDLAGFRIYRAAGTGEFARVGAAEPVAAASFSDRTVQAGASYRYAVSSVDQIGNESARSQPVAVTAPN
jgi:fibronectin type 3 domain-containing protein